MTRAGGFVDYPYHATIEGDAAHDGDTSYLAVVDKDRNMVSFEPSLHALWGTEVVMADLGIIFNCRGDYYSLVAGEANALVPGKRPRSTLQSTLVMKDGRPFLIMGSPGGDDQVMRTMQTLLNVVDFGHERPAGDRSAALVDRAVSRRPTSRTRCVRARCRSRRAFRRPFRKRSRREVTR